MDNSKTITGVIFDPIAKKSIPGRIKISGNKILGIERDERIDHPIILPGFVDSHVHVESSMLIPLEFSRIAAKHGTIAVVADPHEIANTAGIAGIDFMIENSKSAEIKFFFGAPSCVPASPFDECFQAIDSRSIEKLMEREDIYFLGEMMNFPGVISSDEDVLRKIKAAIDKYKKVDGHAPGLSGDSLAKYAHAGISSDHECLTEDEAIEKIRLGMIVLIREGSAAKNFISLNGLISRFPESIMLCTDDCHPEDLIKGHINIQVKKALEIGHEIFNVLQVASVNPVKHYKLNVGLLQKGDFADFIIVDNLQELNIKANFINGVNVLSNDSTRIHTHQIIPEYKFLASFEIEKLEVIAKSNRIRVIGIIEGELVTNSFEFEANVKEGRVVSDIDNDIMKVVVVNRYRKNHSFVGFIKGFKMTRGSIAETIAHDSHHVIAVGVDDTSLYKAIEYVITNRGGICYCNGEEVFGLPLPFYGLMGNDTAENIAVNYEDLNKRVIQDGCKLKAPFMTLSFMALSVIPRLKITPNGLFDVVQFKNTELFVQ
jgi:adenine deaminase